MRVTDIRQTDSTPVCNYYILVRVFSILMKKALLYGGTSRKSESSSWPRLHVRPSLERKERQTGKRPESALTPIMSLGCLFSGRKRASLTVLMCASLTKDSGWLYVNRVEIQRGKSLPPGWHCGPECLACSQEISLPFRLRH